MSSGFPDRAYCEIADALIGKKPEPRIVHFSIFRDRDGYTIDRGLAIYFAAPRSFTGEDVLELHTHGSPVVLDLLLRQIYSLGARPARPGEFSERAFLNGKIDLVQAEAIADLISAGSESAARAAMRSLDGEFSKRVSALFDALVRLRAWLEAALDFPEEEIDFLSAPQLDDRADLAATESRTTCSTPRNAARSCAMACMSSSSAGRTRANRVCSTRSRKANAPSSPRFLARRATCCAKRSISTASR